MGEPVIKGLMPACPTALDTDGRADAGAMKRIVRHMLDNGASGVVPLGGTGEYVSLPPEERIATVESCVEAANGAPVYAGVLAPGLGDALPAARAFQKAGASGLMVLAPYYSPATQDSAKDYFRTMRDAVDLPIMLYDNPYRARFGFSPDSIAELAEDGTIVGMKASNTDLYHFDQVMQRVGPEFGALSGQDTLFAQQVASGAVGGVLTSAVLVPGLWSKVLALVSAGRYAEGLAIQRQLNPLMDALFAEENPGPLRHALSLIGIANGDSPRPAPSVTDGLKSRLADVIDRLRGLTDELPAATA